MEYSSLNIFGAVAIRPTFSLAETAAQIGLALGGVRFTQDEAGTYDEFPSFSAEAVGFSFALLGIPDPAEQVAGDPIDVFTLQIGMTFVSQGSTEDCDASAYFAELLAAKSGLSVVRP